MIRIYNSTYTPNQHLTSNGLKIIEPTKCIEIKSEDEWTLDVELPDTYGEYINQDYIIVVKTREALYQPFRIRNVQIKGHKISFTAYHVFYDLDNYYLDDVYPQDQNGAGALDWVLDRTIPANPFSATSDVATTNTARFVRKSALEALQEIRDRWGGYLTFNNYTINLASSIGSNKGVTIEPGKNLQELSKIENWDNVVTTIYPTCGGRVYDPITADITYSLPYVKSVSFETIYEDETEIEADVIAQATAYLNKHKYPEVNYVVKSDIIQDVQLGDTIRVNTIVDIDTTVLAYRFNVLNQRIIAVEFGNYRVSARSFLKDKATREEVTQRAGEINQVISDQTDTINNLYKNGYVVVEDNEIYIVDTLPKENAIYAIRFNLGGIGFSTNGIAGPFTNAWTIDGKLNASFIKAGKLDGALIEAGTILANQLTVSAKNELRDGLATNDAVDAVNDAVEAQQTTIDQVNTNIQFNTDGITIGKYIIEGGVQKDAKFKMNLNNAQLTFYEDGVAVTWINGQTIYAKNMQATQSIVVGTHKIETYNGRTLIRKV